MDVTIGGIVEVDLRKSFLVFGSSMHILTFISILVPGSHTHTVSCSFVQGTLTTSLLLHVLHGLQLVA